MNARMAAVLTRGGLYQRLYQRRFVTVGGADGGPPAGAARPSVPIAAAPGEPARAVGDL